MAIFVLSLCLFIFFLALLFESLFIAIGKKLNISFEKPNKVRAITALSASVLMFICAILTSGYAETPEMKEEKKQYEEGYAVGYEKGVADGKEEGYKTGKEVGIKEGMSKANDDMFEQGYEKAKAEIEEERKKAETEKQKEIEVETEKPTEESEAEKAGRETAEKINNMMSGESEKSGEEVVAELDEETYKSQCQTPKYNDILRNPTNYMDYKIKISGKVDQLIKNPIASMFAETYTIFLVDGNGNKWGCVYTYKDGESRLLEGDYTTLYGDCKGTDTTETVLGKQVEMPRIDVRYIEQ